MKVLLISPNHSSKARGNTVTVDRWQRGLEHYGVTAKIIGPELLDQTLEIWKPTLIHAHNAVLSGYPALGASKKNDIPLVVSLSGTDLNSISCTESSPICLEVINSACAVVAPFVDNLKSLPKGFNPKVFHVVRRGITEKSIQFSKTKSENLELLLVGGLRPVKGQFRALQIAERLRNAGLPGRLTLIGPVIDASYAETVFSILKSQSFDRYLPTVSHSEMDMVYGNADVLLNCSDNEGSSNAILEAWSCGLSVAARIAPGNNELLEGLSEEIALLFDEEANFDMLLKWLQKIHSRTEHERQNAFARAINHSKDRHSERDEIEELVHVYKSLVSEKGSSVPWPAMKSL